MQDFKLLNQIKNLKFHVPQGSEVVVLDGKVSVFVPIDGKIIEDPSTTDGKDSELELRYVANKEGVELKIGDRLDPIKAIDPGTGSGLQDFEIGYDTKLGRWYLTRFVNYDGNIVGFVGIPPEDPRIYLFPDGIKHTEFNQPYLSYNKNNGKVSIGAPKGHPGVYYTLRPGNDLINVDGKQVILKAIGSGKTVYGTGAEFSGDSHITFTAGRNEIASKVEPFGSYQVFNGDKFFFFEEGLGKPKFIPNKKVNVNNYLAMQIQPKDSRGIDLSLSLADGRTIDKFSHFINEGGDIFTATEEGAKIFSNSRFLNMNEEGRGKLLELYKTNPDGLRSLLGHPDFKNELNKLSIPPYGTFEKRNPGTGSSLGSGISGYKDIGNGYFNSDQGKWGNINLPYVTLEKLAEVSKGKTVSVKISEPHRCGYCRTPVDPSVFYLTGTQARKIGWSGGGFPSTARVRDGRIQ